MEIVISNQALKWFKEDIGLTSGDTLRFYTQIYGNSPVQKGYSLAFTVEEPVKVAVSSQMDGILFYIEADDLWFFDGHDLHVEYDEKEDELEYKYVKP
ncbi:HesB/YadR/YfhF family protein [Bacillus sp. FJAT-29814]|uniref:HesB/YadR/YfhF family protein n=1 Tax=Bacillus sp. FJAT-29814 TaxID=1729688 RepID=UPI00082EE6B3|nr:HesB/YadR/YfhF family protein [Bacillus sp. FJAT-29814]